MSDQPRRRSRRAVAPVTDPTAVEPSGDVTSSAGSRRAAVLEDDTARPPVTLTKAPAPTATPPTASTPTASTPKASTPTATPADSPETAPARAGRRVPVLALALILVGALALAGAVGFGVRAHQLRSTDSARNLALVDTPLTNEVVGQVSAALNQVFSYDYQHPEVTQKAASSLLVGDASGQYKVLFETLQSKAAGQQLTLTTKTLLGGVSSMTPTTARLLVFLDQTSTRVSDKSSSTAAAQLDIAAVKQGSVWKISEIRPL